MNLEAPSHPPRVAAGAATLRLYAMGAALAVASDPEGAPVGRLGAKGAAILAYLALQPGQAASRDALVELLWSQSAPEQGRASLRQEMRRMKRALGPAFDAVIDADNAAIALRPGAVWCDALEIEAAAAHRDADGLSRLADLHRGPFLGPLQVPEKDFQDWTATQASRLDSLTLDGLLRQLLLDQAAGRLERAANAARALLRIDPLQEDVHARLIALLVERGRLKSARAHLEDCRALFREELGEEPRAALEAYENALSSRRAARGAPPAAPAPAREGGDSFSARPLAAFKAADPNSPADVALLRETTAMMANCCWLRVRSCDELFAAGMSPAQIAAQVDYVITLGRRPDEAPRAFFSAARRGDGALVLAQDAEPMPGDASDPARALARRIAGRVTPALLTAEVALERARKTPPDGDFWRLLMAALGLRQAQDAELLRKARGFLQGALELHPDDSTALALLAQLHMAEGYRGLTPDPRAAFFVGREMARRAVRAQPRSALAHYSLGLGASFLEGTETGRALQLRALELNPAYAPAMAELARLFALEASEAEADFWADRALALSPDDARAPMWRAFKALAAYAARRPARALELARLAVAEAPDELFPALIAAASLAELGRMDEAAAALAPHGARLPDPAEELMRATLPFAEEARLDELLTTFKRIAAHARPGAKGRPASRG
ncbi:BTAD domain-containing putative transcriptional regulator [Oceanicella actignis]|uniref:DNA-binding transcriptional activator of the SARP family n=1 Tax=Oceanicella actignis TaxID=1189325 RepID=A0A1M7SGW4_9RHOB|nr:BTAD domain-containing putative transcriptional regulator [Oceanicella actignis]SET20662.1 DNA-binding transcriptional activator of the SARP family [Oceanicella actignis]SHN57701.1 DNA-binding transcriptional activator of the SARP family [Oceanicella actignis]